MVDIFKMHVVFVDSQECYKFYRKVLTQTCNPEPKPRKIVINRDGDMVTLFFVRTENISTFEFQQTLNSLWSSEIRFHVPRGCLGMKMTIEPPLETDLM